MATKKSVNFKPSKVICLFLPLLFPILLFAQKGNYEISLTPFIKTTWHEGTGLGLEYFHREKSSVGLFLSAEFLKYDGLNIIRRYDTYRLAIRMHNYFQAFKNPNIKHYFGLYLDGGLSRASLNVLDEITRVKSAPDLSGGLMVGLFRINIKKFSLKADYTNGFRIYKTTPAELTNIAWPFSISTDKRWGKGYFYRFSCSINYQL